MKTLILKPSVVNIQRCADEIKKGELVAFPTETVYGLGANGLDIEAVKKIYIAKGRPSDNPLILHVPRFKEVYNLAREVRPYAIELAKKFMPGALTLVFKKKDIVPKIVSGGLDTVAIRIPSNPIANLLLQKCGCPLAAPSANTSTKPSPTYAMHVYDDLKGKISYILDGGMCDIGVESTIVDVTGDVPKLLRSGQISVEDLQTVVERVEVNTDQSVALSPGMKYKHYSPKANMLFSAYYEQMHLTIINYYDKMKAQGKKPVIICLNFNKEKYGTREIISIGDTMADYAKNIFAALRFADKKQFDNIIAEGVCSDGIGGAIINRMMKASGGQII